MTENAEKANQAVDHLLPRDVLITKSDVELRSDFKPLADSVRFYTSNQCDQYTHKVDPDGTNLYVFICTIGVAAANVDKNIEDDDFEFDIKLMATFEVVYQSDIELEKESLAAFCDKHVSYHVWPFWREFVFSSCRKAGINEPIPIPLLSIHKMPSTARKAS